MASASPNSCRWVTRRTSAATTCWHSGSMIPRRTAVLTNSGGPGILAADALEAQGLEVVELEAATIARLKPLFPAEASIRDPLDMVASAKPGDYQVALDALLADGRVDSAVAIF